MRLFRSTGVSAMADIQDPRLMYLKAALFLVAGGLAVAVIVSRLPELDIVVALAIAIWSFCRAYYFAFYVIEHYVDPSFRFSGLIDFARYTMSAAKAGDHANHGGQGSSDE